MVKRVIGNCLLIPITAQFRVGCIIISPSKIKLISEKILVTLALTATLLSVILENYWFYFLFYFSEVKARRKNQREARKAAAEQMIQRIQQELECAKLI